MNGYYTTDEHMTSDQLEFAAVMDAREAARERDIRSARARMEPWFKTHTNATYVPYTPPASTYDPEDVILTKTGPATITETRYVANNASWVYAITDQHGSRWIQESTIIGKAI